MTIRSVDMQVLVQKIGDVARVQQTEKSDHQSRQQQFLQQIAQQTEINSNVVNQALASESTLIRDKQSDKKNKRSSPKKQPQTSADDQQVSEWGSDPDRGSNLDIRA